MLEIKNLSKSYGKQNVIDNLSITFSPGVYALLGPNGAGKSTLLNIIAQVIPFETGTLSYNGEIIINNKNYFSKFGYLPQEPTFYPNYTANEMLTYLGCLKGLSRKEIKDVIPSLLESVNLSNVNKKKIKHYSGGMKQRLGIAQSLLNNPDILVLDEPMNGLDPKERVRFRNLIASLGKNKIVIVATHIVNDIVSIADEVIIFNHGMIIQNGKPDVLCKRIKEEVFELVLDDDLLFSTLNISKLQYIDGRYHIKIIGKPTNIACHPASEITLEDVYLYHFGG